MIYGNSVTENAAGVTGSIEDIPQTNLLIESYIADEVAHLSDEQIQEFCNSEEAQALIQEGNLRKKTLVRLSKNDDLSRRTTIAAFHLARAKKDPLWTKLVQNRVKERELIGQILKKYPQASKAAKMGQKEYLSKKMPLSFMRAGGSDR